MKFITTFSWKADAQIRNEAIARFQKTGGLPPKGVTLLGRWTRADFNGGFDLVETDDPQALAEFALMWSDLMELNTYPVLEDQALAAVLQRMVK
ncbi:DUF3303 domain-containing protein [Paraherbaspirillum soli]|uniref:DUF3303 domain-containing protein n=1 Tax=Paraherbaspirillum soli TaxID=631222 RepID=A0ABW0MFF4_9BURK